ncbi:hypothetical protein D9M69_413240 [compost metagenome]
MTGDVENEYRGEWLGMPGSRDIGGHTLVFVLAVLPVPHPGICGSPEPVGNLDCCGSGKKHGTIAGENGRRQILMGSQQGPQLRQLGGKARASAGIAEDVAG